MIIELAEFSQKLQEYRKILKQLQSEKETYQRRRERLSKLSQRRRSEVQKPNVSCYMCNANIEVEDTNSFATCRGCERLVCRSEQSQCCEWIPAIGIWECKSCNSSRVIQQKAGEWLLNQLTSRLQNPGPVSLKDNNLLGLSNTDSDDAQSSTSSISSNQKIKVREFIEELLSSLLNGPLDDISVGQLLKNESYLPLCEGQKSPDSPSDQHFELRKLLHRILAEVAKLPELLNQSGLPLRPEEHLPYFSPKKYEQLLATAVLNKVFEDYRNPKNFEHVEVQKEQQQQKPPQPPNQTPEVDKAGPPTTGATPAGSAPATGTTFDINHNQVPGKSQLNEANLRQMSLNTEEAQSKEELHGRSLSESDESYLSDYIQKHTVPLPDLSDTTGSGSGPEDDLVSLKSNTTDGTWEENWLFKKRQLKSTESSIAMLVPSPTEEVKALIGDKNADEVSDLSEAGSDVEEYDSDSNNKDTTTASKSSVRNTENSLEDPVQDSLVSINSIASNEPVLSEAKNDQLLMEESNRTAIQNHLMDDLISMDHSAGKTETSNPTLLESTQNPFLDEADLMEEHVWNKVLKPEEVETDDVKLMQERIQNAPKQRDDDENDLYPNGLARTIATDSQATECGRKEVPIDRAHNHTEHTRTSIVIQPVDVEHTNNTCSQSSSYNSRSNSGTTIPNQTNLESRSATPAVSSTLSTATVRIPTDPVCQQEQLPPLSPHPITMTITEVFERSLKPPLTSISEEDLESNASTAFRSILSPSDSVTTVDDSDYKTVSRGNSDASTNTELDTDTSLVFEGPYASTSIDSSMSYDNSQQYGEDEFSSLNYDHGLYLGGSTSNVFSTPLVPECSKSNRRLLDKQQPSLDLLELNDSSTGAIYVRDQTQLEFAEQLREVREQQKQKIDAVEIFPKNNKISLGQDLVAFNNNAPSPEQMDEQLKMEVDPSEVVKVNTHMSDSSEASRLMNSANTSGAELVPRNQDGHQKSSNKEMENSHSPEPLISLVEANEQIQLPEQQESNTNLQIDQLHKREPESMSLKDSLHAKLNETSKIMVENEKQNKSDQSTTNEQPLIKVVETQPNLVDFETSVLQLPLVSQETCSEMSDNKSEVEMSLLTNTLEQCTTHDKLSTDSKSNYCLEAGRRSPHSLVQTTVSNSSPEHADVPTKVNSNNPEEKLGIKSFAAGENLADIHIHATPSEIEHLVENFPKHAEMECSEAINQVSIATDLVGNFELETIPNQSTAPQSLDKKELHENHSELAVSDRLVSLVEQGNESMIVTELAAVSAETVQQTDVTNQASFEIETLGNSLETNGKSELTGGDNDKQTILTEILTSEHELSSEIMPNKGIIETNELNSSTSRDLTKEIPNNDKTCSEIGLHGTNSDTPCELVSFVEETVESSGKTCPKPEEQIQNSFSIVSPFVDAATDFTGERISTETAQEIFKDKCSSENSLPVEIKSETSEIVDGIEEECKQECEKESDIKSSISTDSDEVASEINEVPSEKGLMISDIYISENQEMKIDEAVESSPQKPVVEVQQHKTMALKDESLLAVTDVAIVTGSQQHYTVSKEPMMEANKSGEENAGHSLLFSDLPTTSNLSNSEREKRIETSEKMYPVKLLNEAQESVINEGSTLEVDEYQQPPVAINDECLVADTDAAIVAGSQQHSTPSKQSNLETHKKNEATSEHSLLISDSIISSDLSNSGEKSVESSETIDSVLLLNVAQESVPNKTSTSEVSRDQASGDNISPTSYVSVQGISKQNISVPIDEQQSVDESTNSFQTALIMETISDQVPFTTILLNAHVANGTTSERLHSTSKESDKSSEETVTSPETIALKIQDKIEDTVTNEDLTTETVINTTEVPNASSVVAQLSIILENSFDELNSSFEDLRQEPAPNDILSSTPVLSALQASSESTLDKLARDEEVKYEKEQSTESSDIIASIEKDEQQHIPYTDSAFVPEALPYVSTEANISSTSSAESSQDSLKKEEIFAERDTLNSVSHPLTNLEASDQIIRKSSDNTSSVIPLTQDHHQVPPANKSSSSEAVSVSAEPTPGEQMSSTSSNDSAHTISHANQVYTSISDDHDKSNGKEELTEEPIISLDITTPVKQLVAETGQESTFEEAFVSEFVASEAVSTDQLTQQTLDKVALPLNVRDLAEQPTPVNQSTLSTENDASASITKFNQLKAVDDPICLSRASSEESYIEETSPPDTVFELISEISERVPAEEATLSTDNCQQKTDDDSLNRTLSPVGNVAASITGLEDTALIEDPENLTEPSSPEDTSTEAVAGSTDRTSSPEDPYALVESISLAESNGLLKNQTDNFASLDNSDASLLCLSRTPTPEQRSQPTPIAVVTQQMRQYCEELKGILYPLKSPEPPTVVATPEPETPENLEALQFFQEELRAANENPSQCEIKPCKDNPIQVIATSDFVVSATLSTPLEVHEQKMAVYNHSLRNIDYVEEDISVAEDSDCLLTEELQQITVCNVVQVIPSAEEHAVQEAILVAHTPTPEPTATQVQIEPNSDVQLKIPVECLNTGFCEDNVPDNDPLIRGHEEQAMASRYPATQVQIITNVLENQVNTPLDKDIERPLTPFEVLAPLHDLRSLPDDTYKEADDDDLPPPPPEILEQQIEDGTTLTNQSDTALSSLTLPLPTVCVLTNNSTNESTADTNILSEPQQQSQSFISEASLLVIESDLSESSQLPAQLDPEKQKPPELANGHALNGKNDADDAEENLIPGSIAEREHLKWRNASPIANNPYSPDVLQKRLSESNRFSNLADFDRLTSKDLTSVTSEVSAQAEPTVAPKEEEELTENDRSLQSVLGENPVQFQRYGRDYYINDAKRACGTRKADQVVPSQLSHSTDDEKKQDQPSSQPLSPIASPSLSTKKQQPSAFPFHKSSSCGNVIPANRTEDIFSAGRPVEVAPSDEILKKGTKVDYLSTPARAVYLVPVDEPSTPRSLGSSSELSMTSRADESLTYSEDSDVTRIYEIGTCETKLVHGDVIGGLVEETAGTPPTTPTNEESFLSETNHLDQEQTMSKLNGLKQLECEVISEEILEILPQVVTPVQVEQEQVYEPPPSPTIDRSHLLKPRYVQIKALSPDTIKFFSPKKPFTGSSSNLATSSAMSQSSTEIRELPQPPTNHYHSSLHIDFPASRNTASHDFTIEKEVMEVLPSVKELAKCYSGSQQDVNEVPKPILKPRDFIRQSSEMLHEEHQDEARSGMPQVQNKNRRMYSSTSSISAAEEIREIRRLNLEVYNRPTYVPMAPGHSITARSLSKQIREELKTNATDDHKVQGGGHNSPERPSSPVFAPGHLRSSIQFFESLRNK